MIHRANDDIGKNFAKIVSFYSLGISQGINKSEFLAYCPKAIFTEKATNNV